MNQIRPRAAIAAAFISGVLYSANDVVAAPCVRSREQIAIYTAELRAQLMVAALSCGQQRRYNSFVTRFQHELTTHGRALRLQFKRQYGAAGDHHLNEFVTRLSNRQSQRSATARASFCAQATVLFHQLLDEPRLSLAGVLGDPALVSDDRLTCADPSLVEREAPTRSRPTTKKPLPIEK